MHLGKYMIGAQNLRTDTCFNPRAILPGTGDQADCLARRSQGAHLTCRNGKNAPDLNGVECRMSAKGRTREQQQLLRRVSGLEIMNGIRLSEAAALCQLDGFLQAASLGKLVKNEVARSVEHARNLHQFVFPDEVLYCLQYRHCAAYCC